MEAVEAVVAQHGGQPFHKHVLVVAAVGEALQGADAAGSHAVARELRQFRVAIAPRAAVQLPVDVAHERVEHREVDLDPMLLEGLDQALELVVGPRLPVTLRVVGLAGVGAVVRREHDLALQSA